MLSRLQDGRKAVAVEAEGAFYGLSSPSIRIDKKAAVTVKWEQIPRHFYNLVIFNKLTVLCSRVVGRLAANYGGDSGLQPGCKPQPRGK
jgi:hypothetical protein